ncbi:hypothetical protein ACI77O_12475 [Pseudomonas tritici]|uniref:hypothetical protein n=1 Tax=Pseudomonas tritici TaxID=2745518 RepID=UPI00387ABCC8
MSQDERWAQSVEEDHRTAESLGLVKRSLAELRQEFDLPADAPFLGYVVHIPARDEFLVEYKNDSLATSRIWTKNPAMALQFQDFAAAYKLTREGEEIVVGLFETDTQFVVAEVL